MIIAIYLLILIFIVVLFFVFMGKNSEKGNNNKFVKDSLLPNEHIIATAKFHPMKVWGVPFLLFLLSFVVGKFFGGGLFLALILLTFLTFLLNRWMSKYDEFVITNKRVVAKAGVIRRVAFELQSEQVESIEIYQGVFGRILNYGTLMPCGIGASKVRIGFVVNPFEFRQHFYDLKKPQNNISNEKNN